MSGDPTDDFPVETPESAAPATKDKAAIWTPEKRREFGERMKRLKAEKRAERGSGAPTRAASKAPRSARTSAPSSELAEIETSIVEGLTKLGGAVTPIAPIPGVYTIQTAEDIGAILTRLAAKNPAILKALSGSSTMMDYVGLGVWAAGMFVAVNVQMGRIPADSRAAQNYHLTEIAVEFYGDRLYAEPEPDRDLSPVEGSGSAFDPFQVPTPPDIAEAEARAFV